MRKINFKDMVTLAKRRWLLAIFIVAILIIVIIQVFLPSNITVPFAKVSGRYYGFNSVLQIESLLQSKFMDTKLGVSVSGDLREYKLSKIGAELDINNTAKELFDYPLSLRFIPFSVFFYTPEVDRLSIKFNGDRLREFTDEFAATYSLDSKDANIKIEGDQIAVDSSVLGYSVDSSRLRDKIQSQDYILSEKSTIAASLDFIEPAVNDDDVKQAREQLDIALSKSVVVSDDTTGQQFKPAREVIASWLGVEKSEDGNISVSLREKQVSEYVDVLNSQVGNLADPTLVTYRDGVEVERVEGSKGVGVDQDKFMASLHSTIFLPTSYSFVPIELISIEPTDRVSYVFSNSESGLAAKLNELTSRYNAKISVKQLDGGRWTANSKGAETWPSASTYKLYVASMLFNKIESGDVKWDDQMLGRSVASCFESMIVVSTNECAEEWLRKFGRGSVESHIYQYGISNATRFTDSGPARTSANDLVKVVESFASGRLANADNSGRLLNAMGRQVWRSGIPSGSSGSVQDKVGFLWDYTHDVGLVRHPRGSYIIAVMTKGHNYGTISQITKEIEQVMYP